MNSNRKRVVIVGSGWAGLTTANSISQAKYDIIVVSPHATSPYTPLLASAACGMFDFRLIEEPVRRNDRYLQYLKAKVEVIDFDTQSMTCIPACGDIPADEFKIDYDILVLAPGCETNTFNTPGVKQYAYSLKTVQDAMAVRSRLANLLEAAALPSTSAERQKQLLHIAIVGGGPTGIEMAAELSDMFRNDIAQQFPILLGKASITIHDVAPQILAPYEKSLSEYATASLKDHRIEIKADSHIINVNSEFIETKEDGKIPYGMLIWATGNKSVPLVDGLDVAKTAKGVTRVLTDNTLRVRKKDGGILSNVFAIGDAADIDGETLPTTAEVATQKAKYLAALLNGNPSTVKPFRYKQKLMITYTGSGDGIVQGQHEYTGEAAWLGWRSSNVTWASSWRRAFMICLYWMWHWLDCRQTTRRL